MSGRTTVPAGTHRLRRAADRRIARLSRVAALLLAAGCRSQENAAASAAAELPSARFTSTAVAPLTSAGCEATPAVFNALFERGGDLISPYMVLSDRAPAPEARRRADITAGIACLDRALALEPTSFQAHWIKGKGFQAVGDHTKARESFAASHQLAPDHVDVARELGVSMLELGAFTDAVEVWGDSARRHPADAGVVANLALALTLAGEITRAQETIRRAVALDPKDRISLALQTRIDEIASGKRKQPQTYAELTK